MSVRTITTCAFGALLASTVLLASGCGSDSSSSTAKDEKPRAASAKSDDDSAGDDEARDEPSSEAAGTAYEDAVVPLVDELQPLLQRYDSVGDKLVAGSIDVARATEAFQKQAASARTIAARVRAVHVGDEHLDAANEDLAKSFDEYAFAMTEFTAFDDSMGDAQIDAVQKKGERHLDAMFAALDTWSDALVDDPEGRDFTRTGDAFTRLSKFADSLG